MQSTKPHRRRTIHCMNDETLAPCPTGFTTVRPGAYIVYSQPDFANKFWATDDGKSCFSASSVAGLAGELRMRHARILFGLPKRGAPALLQDIAGDDAQALLAEFQD